MAALHPLWPPSYRSFEAVRSARQLCCGSCVISVGMKELEGAFQTCTLPPTKACQLTVAACVSWAVWFAWRSMRRASDGRFLPVQLLLRSAPLHSHADVDVGMLLTMSMMWRGCVAVLSLTGGSGKNSARAAAVVVSALAFTC